MIEECICDTDNFVSDQEAIISQFIPRIIRAGCEYHFPDNLAFEVLMTNPVQQGYITSSDRTRVLTVDLSDSREEGENTTSATINTVSSAINLLQSPTTPNVIEPTEFNVEILKNKWPEARLYPSPNNTNDDESRVFVDVKDLAECGVFSGDWVLVTGNNPKKSRLCRVFGVESEKE